MLPKGLAWFETRVYDAVHAEYDGLTIAEAAIKLTCSKKKIRQSIRRLRKYVKVTLLTKMERRIRNFILEDGLAHKQIAVILETGVKNVERVVQNLHKKGVKTPVRAKTISYNPLLDNRVIRKF